jgi:hypothetical protein
LRWGMLLVAIVAIGLLPRAADTGFPLFDKYLGDALYAAMVYVVLRMAAPGTSILLIGGVSAAVMVGLSVSS